MRPPSWLPFLGPPVAGVTAGVLGRSEPNVWLLILVATAVGFLPIIGYRLWKRWHHRQPE